MMMVVRTSTLPRIEADHLPSEVEGSRIDLSATVTHPGGIPFTSEWTVQRSPTRSAVALQGDDADTTRATAWVAFAGTYTFRLTVVDGEGVTVAFDYRVSVFCRRIVFRPKLLMMVVRGAGPYIGAITVGIAWGDMSE